MMTSKVMPEIADHSYASKAVTHNNPVNSSKTPKDPKNAASTMLRIIGVEESVDNESLSGSSVKDSNSDLGPEEPPQRSRAPPQKYGDGQVAFHPSPSPKTPKGKISVTKVRKYPTGRLKSCGNCVGCKLEDCGACIFCKDKLKFGGPGKKKQRCVHRKCMKVTSHQMQIQGLAQSVSRSESPAGVAAEESLSKPDPTKSSTLSSSASTVTANTSTATVTRANSSDLVKQKQSQKESVSRSASPAGVAAEESLAKPDPTKSNTLSAAKVSAIVSRVTAIVSRARESVSRSASPAGVAAEESLAKPAPTKSSTLSVSTMTANTSTNTATVSIAKYIDLTKQKQSQKESVSPSESPAGVAAEESLAKPDPTKSSLLPASTVTANTSTSTATVSIAKYIDLTKHSQVVQSYPEKKSKPIVSLGNVTVTPIGVNNPTSQEDDVSRPVPIITELNSHSKEVGSIPIASAVNPTLSLNDDISAPKCTRSSSSEPVQTPASSNTNDQPRADGAPVASKAGARNGSTSIERHYDSRPRAEQPSKDVVNSVETARKRASLAGLEDKRLLNEWELLARNLMRCEQCGRERSLKVSRTNRFCTQRCVIDWLKDNPNKTPKEAVGESKVPLFALHNLAETATSHAKPSKPSGRALSRALKNLEIDMAPPGSTLPQSDSENSDMETEVSAPPKKARFSEPAIVSAKSSSSFTQQHSIVETGSIAAPKKTRFSEPAIVSAKSSALTPQHSIVETGSIAAPKKTRFSEPAIVLAKSSSLIPQHSIAEAGSITAPRKTRFSEPATVSAKRSSFAPQPSAIKKRKQTNKRRSPSPVHTSKTVKFDLNSTVGSTYSKSTGFSIVPLDRLAQLVKDSNKTPQAKPSITIPKGLSTSISDWTVDNVFTYFKSTKDYSKFADILKDQKIDGFALLRLTEQLLISGLQLHSIKLPLGDIIRLVAHVEDMKLVGTL